MVMPGGHLIIRDGAQSLLVNTGCPVSMGTRPSLVFLDHEIAVLQRYQGLTVAQWSEIIGLNIDGILGSDVLGRHSVVIDPDRGRMVFDEKLAPESQAQAIPVSTVAGLPVLAVGLAGARVQLLLHTGATLSCLRDSDTKDYPCIAVVRDCYPGLGEFTTELRQVPLLFGGQRINLDCGLMPAPLEQALHAVQVAGVVGANLLQQFALAWGPNFQELSIVERRDAATPLHPAPSAMPRPHYGTSTTRPANLLRSL